MKEKEAVEKEIQEKIDYVLSQKESIVLNLENILMKKWKTHADSAVGVNQYGETTEEQEIVKLYLNDNGFLRKKILEMGFFPYYSEDSFSNRLYIGTKWQIFIKCPFSIFYIFKHLVVSLFSRGE